MNFALVFKRHLKGSALTISEPEAEAQVRMAQQRDVFNYGLYLDIKLEQKWHQSVGVEVV